MEERFPIVTDHGPGGLAVAPSCLGTARSADVLVAQVFLDRGRDAGKRRRFDGTLADGLHARVGLLREDAVVRLVEVGREDRSFGDGEDSSPDILHALTEATMMRCVRIWTGDDGDPAFEEGTVDMPEGERGDTPDREDDSVDIAEALDVNTEFDVSRQLRAHLVGTGAIPDPRGFLHPCPP